VGRKKEAKRLLDQLLKKHEYVPCWFLAMARVGLGEKERALDALEQAFSNHEPCMVRSPGLLRVLAPSGRHFGTLTLGSGVAGLVGAAGQAAMARPVMSAQIRAAWAVVEALVLTMLAPGMISRLAEP
jgi:hypothetical protein